MQNILWNEKLLVHLRIFKSYLPYKVTAEIEKLTIKDKTMKSQLFKTDEAIMNEYSKLYDLYGETEEGCNEIIKLTESIIPEKQDLWKIILNGILSGFMCNGNFQKSYKELNKIIIEDKESPLFIFVEREKMYACALIDAPNFDKAMPAYDELINHFNNSTDIAIQLQVAQTMLTKSFLLGLIGNLEGEIQVTDELLTKFGQSDDISIQTIIAQSINNKAHTLERLLAQKENETVKLREIIIDTYKNTQDVRMQLQVSKSMYNNALSFRNLFQVEKATLFPTQGKKEYYVQKVRKNIQ
jgi:hypothetical protein